MNLKPILTVLAVACSSLAQSALANWTYDKNGEPTHYKGIPVDPIPTVEEARAATEKRMAAIKAEEAKQAAQAAELASRDSLPATTPQELFFTGKPYLEETGQYLFLFRHYDPELGRWTTADPSGFPDGANNRVYAPTPTTGLDPFGLWSAQDYAWHYFWGKSPYAKGETVDLDVSGDLNSVKIHSNQHASGPVAFEAEIENLLIGKLSARYMGSHVNATTKSVNIDYESIVLPWEILICDYMRPTPLLASKSVRDICGSIWQHLATLSTMNLLMRWIYLTGFQGIRITPLAHHLESLDHGPTLFRIADSTNEELFFR